MVRKSLEEIWFGSVSWRVLGLVVYVSGCKAEDFRDLRDDAGTKKGCGLQSCSASHSARASRKLSRRVALCGLWTKNPVEGGVPETWGTTVSDGSKQRSV